MLKSQSIPLNLVEIEMKIVPDWNRDRVIDTDDEGHVTDERPLRWWINDDDDDGDISDRKSLYIPLLDSNDDDLPGRTAYTFPRLADFSTQSVDGRTDLEDFFPLWLDLHDAMDLLPPEEGFEYRLRHEDRAVNFTYIDVTKDLAGIYLTEETDSCGSTLLKGAFEADTIEVANTGTVLMSSFLDLIEQDPDKGIVMVEGAALTTSPLYLEILKDARVIERVDLPLSISGVEQMLRWINLRHVICGWDCENRNTDVNEPENYPDVESNGKQFVFVHGLSNREEDARAWGSEMFKRLYQSGSRAMLTAVTWRSDESKFWNEIPVIGGATLDYYINVQHALDTAEDFRTEILGLPGTKYITAHSLGNMLVSSAIKDRGLVVETYFLLNAAVASEAYDPETIRSPDSTILMNHPDWEDYARRLWPSDWWRLFPVYDSRHSLKWADYFAAMPNGVNLFSSGEDILRKGDGRLHLTPSHPMDFFEHLEWLWTNQEMRKGTLMMAVLPGNSEGGWEFNAIYAGMPPAQANDIPDESLRQIPFFAFFDDMGIFNIFSGSDFLLQGETNVRESAIYRRLMADAIPALSDPAGGNGMRTEARDGGFDPENIFHEIKDLMDYKRGNYASGNWPREFDRWKHSDIKVIAYPFNSRAFDAIVRSMETGSLEE
jgi:hypothetical protein